jgi:hypothetical protein
MKLYLREVVMRFGGDARRVTIALIPLAVALAAGAARAEGEGPAAAADAKGGDLRLKRDHDEQGFVNLLFGTGFYLVAPKDKNDPERQCGISDEDNGGEALCVGRSAMHLEFLGGYGVLPRFEVFAIFRLGVEPAAPGRVSQRQLGAGVKVYSPRDGLFKIGIGIAPLFDFSKHADIDGHGADLGYDFIIHVPIDFQFDIVRWVGVYAQLAPNVSFITEFRFDIALGLGVQGRFP